MTEPAALDLDAYLARVGHAGPLRRDSETLAALLGAHMNAIPFENLDVLLGRPVKLDLASVQTKLVTARRGGYCFEHATLLAAALERVGFAPVAHTARVTVVAPLSQAPRTHMFLTVVSDGETFVLDPGFGALAPRVPVPLRDGGRVRVGAEEHAMARDGAMWVLRARRGDDMLDAWTSTLERDYPVDFELGNHYTATHPASSFRSRLMMRVLTPEGRITVSNRDVTTTCAGVSSTRRLLDRRDLRNLLVEHFGFDLPEVETLRVPSEPEWT